MEEGCTENRDHITEGRDSTANPGYSFSLVNIDCLPTSDSFNIIMNLEEPIEELLPHLAGSLPGCTYIHGSGVLNLMDDGHIVALHRQHITITEVDSWTEAENLCETYFRHISLVRSSKDSYAPVYEKQRTMTILDIFRLLPRTNCGLCSSPTCMAFAAKLYRHKGRVSACTPLKTDVARYEELLRRLQDNGYKTS
jgi:ArsR family metal-binding transcriptional regulator